MTGMTMLHGLWKEFLATEFLWYTTQRTAVVRSKQFPTWSWASITGAKLNAIHLSPTELSTYESYVSFESAHDMTGTLNIRGPLFFDILQRNARGGYFSQVRYAEIFRFDPDIDFPERGEVWRLVVSQWGPGEADGRPGCSDQGGSAGLMLEPVDGEGSIYRRAGFWMQETRKEIDSFAITPADYVSLQLK